MRDGWYWYKTPWACGGVLIKHNMIIDNCPIYKRMIGWNSEVMKRYEYKWIGD